MINKIDEDELFKCNACGHESHFDDFDTGGSCPGNFFCPNCDEEIDADGNPNKCGKCSWCVRQAKLEKLEKFAL